MSLSNFQKVIEFNNTFGITVHNEPQHDIFDTDPKLVTYRLSLIREEINELSEAIENHDFVEIIDALADILYVVYGMGCSIGADLDLHFKNTYNTNNLALNNYNLVKSLFSVVPSSPLSNIFNENDKLLALNIKLSSIQEEFTKLENVTAEKCFDQVVECLVELTFKVYDMGISVGVDMDKAYALVHDSNMSKLCINEEEAQQTVKWYKENEDRYDTPSYRLSYDGKYWVIFNKSTKKILKSINYHPVDLKPIC